jgi:hypothetical protein
MLFHCLDVFDKFLDRAEDQKTPPFTLVPDKRTFLGRHVQIANGMVGVSVAHLNNSGFARRVVCFSFDALYTALALSETLIFFEDVE